MATDPSKPHVVVVGGGIIGVSTATHLARLGHPVTLVTEGSLGDGASGRSLAWLNSSRHRSAAYHRLRMAGLDRYRALAAELPDCPWLVFGAGLTWDADDPSNDIAAAHAHEVAIGYPSQRLSAAEAATAVPGVDPRTIGPQGAIFNPVEGWVHLPALIAHLMGELRARGGRVVTQAGPAKIDIESGRATGVSAERCGFIAADAVVLATGAAVPATLAACGVVLPHRSPVSLLIETQPVATPLRAVLNTPRVSLRPTPTGTLVLDAGWTDAQIVALPDNRYTVQPPVVAELLSAASLVLAGQPHLALKDCAIGPKPVPADGEPVLGPVPGIESCFIAFTHSGATLGLIVGELLAAEIASHEINPLLAPFRPERFTG